MEPVGRDVELGSSVAARDGLQCLAKCAAGEHSGERNSRFTGGGREGVDVDEAGDVAGVGIDVRDHGAAVGVTDQDDGSVDGSDEVADRVSVGG